MWCVRYGAKRLVLMSVILSALTHYYSLQWLAPLPTPELGLQVGCRDSKTEVSVMRDPCMLERMRRLYANTSLACRRLCEGETEARELELRPGEAQMDETEILLPGGSCPTEGREQCGVDCPGEVGRLISLSSHTSSHASSQSPYSCWQYWLYVWVITLASLSFGTGCTLQESLCHQLLGEEADRRYGQHRLWASVGWGLSAAVSGYLVDMDSQHSLLYNYQWAFTIMLVCWTADILVVSKLDIPEEKVTSSNPWADVGGLLSSPRTLVFLSWCAMVGFVFGSMGLHFWLLEDLAGVSTCQVATNLKLLQGLCLTVNCLGETPVFFVSGRLIKWLGTTTGMVLVLLAHGVRLLYYSLIASPWQILPAELLQGVTFGFFFPCLVSVSAELSPPGAQTTMTALAWLTSDIGGSLGGWVSAALYQVAGGSFTFWVYGWLSLTGAALTLLLQRRHSQPCVITNKVSVC